MEEQFQVTDTKQFLDEQDLQGILADIEREPGASARLPQIIGNASGAKVLQEYLLAQTLRYVKHQSRYYGRLISHDTNRQRVPLSELRNLPMINKQILLSNYKRILSTERYPALMGHTSGTTGSPLEVPIFFKEARVRALLATISTLVNHPDVKKMTVLSLIDFYHGSGVGYPLSTPVAYKAILFEVFQGEYGEGSRYLRGKLHRIEDILFGESQITDSFGRPTVLSTNPKEFVMLTRMLSKAGHELKSAGIRVVSTRGDYVSPHVRRIAHDFWGAELIDTYGSAELCGGASQCEHGSYHFDLTEIPEIFFGKENQVHDPANVGEIVITPLHPFQQALPLLRYMTGDLAKFTESCSCGRREVAISQFWGRRDSCLTITVGGHRSVLLSPFTLSDRLQDTNACSTTSRGVEECYPRFAWRMKRNGEKQTIIVVVKIRRGIGSHNSLVTRAVGEAIQGMLSPYSMDSTKVKIQVHQVTTDLPKSVDV